ncbi:BtrH N-terminal domain-containing protein [Kitasatospora aureofaciens]|uniref:BtrH N-terminal domain-containing protein n=1 Tax=Kitasatospora aureofaciens TaxID=1894 RepID=UPI001C465412|nr:BtrH N-terminal domain-containing protein [Kitasatospora aureofaciens]MBV6702052.1 BtrH N-terminal domain-containing protein [Kitasatospora aureofaciens]
MTQEPDDRATPTALHTSAHSIGAHCETAALRTQLAAHGLDLSEAMLFGLAGGINFMHMPAPPGGRGFTGGRNGPFPDFTRRMAAGVGLDLDVAVTDDPDRAWRELRTELDQGRPAVVYVDLFHLPYFHATRHFGAHAVVILDHDPRAGTVTVSDRPALPQTIGTAELATARASGHQPFPPRHALLHADWKAARPPAEADIRQGIRLSCRAMLHPPVPTFGLRGLDSFGAGLRHLLRSDTPPLAVVEQVAGNYVDFELAGTGGNAFRNLFQAFLTEAATLTGDNRLADAALLCADSAGRWEQLLAVLLPDWTPAFAELGETYRAKEVNFLAGTADSLAEAARLGERLPALRAAAADELGPVRSRLAEEVAEAVRTIAETERELFALLGDV